LSASHYSPRGMPRIFARPCASLRLSCQVFRKAAKWTPKRAAPENAPELKCRAPSKCPARAFHVQADSARGAVKSASPPLGRAGTLSAALWRASNGGRCVSADAPAHLSVGSNSSENAPYRRRRAPALSGPDLNALDLRRVCKECVRAISLKWRALIPRQARLRGRSVAAP
jgi:hypothetical protein